MNASKASTYYVTSDQGDDNNNFVDLAGIVFDTLPSSTA